MHTCSLLHQCKINLCKFTMKEFLDQHWKFITILTENLEGQCDCFQPCIENSYDNELSFTNWPEMMNAEQIMEKYVRRNVYFREQVITFRQLFWRNLRQKNVLKDNVFPHDCCKKQQRKSSVLYGKSCRQRVIHTLQYTACIVTDWEHIQLQTTVTRGFLLQCIQPAFGSSRFNQSEYLFQRPRSHSDRAAAYDDALWFGV